MTYTQPNTAARTPYGAYDRDYDYSRTPSDLQRLDELDNYKVADDEMDPRGYSLIGRDGEEVGTIENLLASPSEGKALFAIVDTGGWFQSKRFVIPLQMIAFDEDEAHGPFVRSDFENAPQYEGENRDLSAYHRYWSGLPAASALARGTTETRDDRRESELSTDTTNEIRVPVTEETMEVRKERRRSGYLSVHKSTEVETRHISEPVQRTRVDVETREVTEGEGYVAPEDATHLKDGETLRIPVVEEELRVEKTPRVTKEVIVRAEPEVEQVERDVQLRREHVEVEEEGEVNVAGSNRGSNRR